MANLGGDIRRRSHRHHGNCRVSSNAPGSIAARTANCPAHHQQPTKKWCGHRRHATLFRGWPNKSRPSLRNRRSDGTHTDVASGGDLCQLVGCLTRRVCASDEYNSRGGSRRPTLDRPCTGRVASPIGQPRSSQRGVVAGRKADCLLQGERDISGEGRWERTPAALINGWNV